MNELSTMALQLLSLQLVNKAKQTSNLSVILYINPVISNEIQVKLSEFVLAFISHM